jgi:hypothetical protein
MFKAFAFLTKKDGLGMQEFIDYYEGKHIPLILSLAPSPLIYKRRYIERDQELTKSGNLVDYDVMTELGFADQEEFASWMGKRNRMLAFYLRCWAQTLFQPTVADS